MAADQWPLSLWLVASFFLQLAFPRTLHPLPQPPATQKTIDPIAIPGWSTVVTSVDVAGLVILCEVSFSFRVDHEGFAEWREFKARPCIVWPPGGVAPERAFQHKFKFSYSDTKSLDCSASASVVGVGLGLIPVYFKVDEGKFKETLSCSIEEDQESVAEVQKSEVEVFTIPIGQGDSTVIKCPGPEVPFQGNLTADWDWLDDSDPDDPDEYPYCPDSDCSNSDNTDLDIKARPVTPKYQYEYMPQELNHRDVHIYQTSKLIAYYENRPNKHRLFMIVTKISATNTIVTASQYGEDV